MRAPLVVRENAPLVTPPSSSGTPGALSIRAFAFRPGTVAVPRNSLVRWTNDDATPHTVTARGGAFGSKPLAKGTSSRHRFTAPGRYRYFCALHPSMSATLVVR